MSDLLALIAVILWPAVPLFWIPVHSGTKIFRRLGLLTYIMPLVTWLPLAYLIYINRVFLLKFKIDLPMVLNLTGMILLVSGTFLHIWTARLLGLRGLVGLPEISGRKRGRLMTEGPFSVVRHPTYLAHTLMFLGVFLITEVISAGIVTLLDFILINIAIIPLEDKELSVRFGKDYEIYRKEVPGFFPKWN